MKHVRHHPPPVTFAYARRVRTTVHRQWFGQDRKAAEAAMAADIEAQADNPRITPLHVEDSTGRILAPAEAPPPAKSGVKSGVKSAAKKG